MNTETQTIVKKSFRGWYAEQFESVNGYDFKIYTSKGHNGRITSTATAGTLTKDSDGVRSFTYSPFQSKQITFKLVDEKRKATEKAVKEIHYKALAEFDKLKEAGDLPTNNEGGADDGFLKRGQYIFLNGYGQSQYSHEEKVIFNRKTNDFGTSYEYVNLKTLEIGYSDHIRPASEIFGIGTYYIENKIMAEEELNNIVIEAKAKQKKDRETAEAAKLLHQQLTAAKIEEGKKLISIPSNAKAVIVAELWEDDSDPQTDYFNTKTTDILYLAFSTNTRDNFAEMRKAANNCDIEEVKALATAPTVNSSGETKEQYLEKMREHYKDDKQALRYWNAADENREKYTGGKGYYLKKRKYSRSGWVVQKESYYDLTKEENKNRLYIAAAEGRCYFNTEAETAAPAEQQNINVNNLDLVLVDYSAKALAIFGDTKAIKDDLKKLGGRFNPYLKHNEEKRAGWIFPKANREKINAFLNQ